MVRLSVVVCVSVAAVHFVLELLEHQRRDVDVLYVGGGGCRGHGPLGRDGHELRRLDLGQLGSDGHGGGAGGGSGTGKHRGSDGVRDGAAG
jgi:hypothetical protein